MTLLPGWQDRLDQRRAGEVVAVRRAAPMPLNPLATCQKPTLIADARSAEDLIEALKATSVSAIALDVEHTYGRSALLPNGDEWRDIRSIQPICISAAVWCPERDGHDGVVVQVVLDVRQPGVATYVSDLLRLASPAVFHDVKPFLFALWSLGLDPDLHNLYDTLIAARALNLGRFHKRAEVGTRGMPNQIEREHDLDLQREHHLSLVHQCREHGMSPPYSDCKEALTAHIVRAGVDGALTTKQVEMAAIDAELTLRLYLAQSQQLYVQGLHSALFSIEFPFAVVNARIEWNGVHVDQEQCGMVREAAQLGLDHFGRQLRELGVDPDHPDSFLRFMAAQGLAELFEHYGHTHLGDDLLRNVASVHPAIQAYREYLRCRRLLSEPWLVGLMRGADGRVHPNHEQLETATGRNSCLRPALTSIGRKFRPVVTAPPCRAIVELDYRNFELAIAAGASNDPHLLEVCRSEDAYSVIAQQFYREQLSADELALSPSEFKQCKPELRAQAKLLSLAIIYNMQARSLALRLGVPRTQAERLRERILRLFPTLTRYLEDAARFGLARGHANIILGLRRRVWNREAPRQWIENYLRNTPIQGSAAVVFKRALIDLYRAFRGTSVLLILPVHDSIVIECDRTQVHEVAAQAKLIMEAALRSFYSNVDPKVDVNKSHVHCWNKDGHADSIERFLDDPTYEIGAPSKEVVISVDMDPMVAGQAVGAEPALVLADRSFQGQSLIGEYLWS